jgi:hypothetical protein
MSQPKCDFDELTTLLEEQLQLAHRGKIEAVEILSERVRSAAERIAKAGICESAEFNEQRRRLQELHDRLCLTLNARKTEVAADLSRIRKGKKALGTYRSSI